MIARLSAHFEFRIVPTVCMLVALCILVALGSWQVKRLNWKQGLVASVEARVNADPIAFKEALARFQSGEDMTYTPVTIEGVFANQHEAHVFGTLNAKPGYYVFAPLMVAGRTDPVYINRGFVLQRFKAQSSRSDGLLQEPVQVTGLFRVREKLSGVSALVQPVDNPDTNEWYQRNPEIFARHAGLNTVDAYIDTNGQENLAAWPKGGTTRLAFNNRHLEYALTWYGLALTLIGVWGAYSWRRPDKSAMHDETTLD